MVFGMFTLSCFNPHVLSRRTKKTVETSAEAMEKNSELSASSKLGLKSEDIKPKASFKHDIDVRHRMNLKKSLSIGSELYMAARTSVDNDTDESGHMFSSDFPNESIDDALKRQPSLRGEGSESKGLAFRSNHRSVFLAEDPSHSEKVSPQLSDSSLSDGQVENSGNRSWNFSRGILRSSSLPNIIESPPALASRNTLVQARSSDDLRALETRKIEHLVHKVGPQPTKQEETVKDLHKSENDKVESFSIPLTDEGEPGKPVHKELLLPNSDFKTERIEAWVSELQHCSEQDEAFESSDHDDEVQPDLKAAKEKETLTPGMVAVRKYVSLLSLSATTAQLVNQGLTVIPFLSAFPSLRVLNLTGNSIVRITAGALPRGLHELKLSKNNISTIEGFRELTRLRKLDLRYNRILRIGHGLASCSSLKELYLAGNRISEVEGLHRLLKLSVLDLRFNKISTAKSLGQLAANYNSLQAISLEGNPAQKNVGDEQLKKYLQGLLPKLAYLNSIPIKTSSLKDTADRSVRLTIGANRLDRSLRSELKSTRRSGHGVKQELKRPVAGSKGRSARPPVAGVPAMAHGQQHYLDVFGNRVLNFGSQLSIRRSRSAGTLASLPVS